MLPLLLASLAFSSEPFAAAQKAYSEADAGRVLALYREAGAKDARDYALIGKAWYLKGDFDKAASELGRAVADEPGSAEYHLWLGRALGRRAENAPVFYAPGLAVQSRKAFEKAVELAPASTDALSDLLEYYRNAPGFLGGGMDKARALVPRIRASSLAQGLLAEALLAEQRKDFTSAGSLYEKAASADPSNAGRLIDLAGFYVRRERWADADGAFDRAAAIDPGSAALMFARAEAYLTSGRKPEEARRLLLLYLDARLTPDDPPRREAEKLLAKVSK